jgi:lipopolysaccharide export LptBFGC system permease protein LptF
MLFLDFAVTLVMELENLSNDKSFLNIFNLVLYEQLHKGMQYLESSMLIGTLISLTIFNQQGNLVFLRSAGFSPLKIVLVSGLGPLVFSLVLIFLDETLFMNLAKTSKILNHSDQSAKVIQWEMANKNLIGLSRLSDSKAEAIRIIEFNDQQKIVSFASFE